jgi:hypothetical protein
MCDGGSGDDALRLHLAGGDDVASSSSVLVAGGGGRDTATVSDNVEIFDVDVVRSASTV